MIFTKTVDDKLPEFNLEVKSENEIEKSHVIDAYIKKGLIDGLITLKTELDETINDKLMLHLKDTNVYVTIKKDVKGFFIEELKNDYRIRLFLKQVIDSRTILESLKEQETPLDRLRFYEQEIMPYPKKI